ncbi:MAG TPA: hypothetical protein VGS78_11040 [Candidatus Sulfotelmatobacter sp.]|nr:hypothetical protein [Candidatus Sulfotelmatobacter sp.]
MHFRRAITGFLFLTLLISCGSAAQTGSSSSSSAKHAKPSSAHSAGALDDGWVTNGNYKNNTLGLSCKIPDGWVLRTDEMNQHDQQKDAASPSSAKAETGSNAEARVLLAAFSRPPEARAEDVNSSILIAAESASSYPGLKEAAQYFGPLTEVAKAQGFTVDEEPYEIALGTKTLVRSDFHKDVGTRVMHQSTLAMLAHGYAISITVIGGTDDEVEDLIDGLNFTGK